MSLKELAEPAAACAAEQNYDVWKDGKLRRALKQSEDRSVMIPSQKVWARFGFER